MINPYCRLSRKRIKHTLCGSYAPRSGNTLEGGPVVNMGNL